MVLCTALTTEEEPPRLLVLQRQLECWLLKIVKKSKKQMNFILLNGCYANGSIKKVISQRVEHIKILVDLVVMISMETNFC